MSFLIGLVAFLAFWGVVDLAYLVHMLLQHVQSDD